MKYLGYTLCICTECDIIDRQCTIYAGGDANMETKDQVRELRNNTGMNRKEFCEYFG